MVLVDVVRDVVSDLWSKCQGPVLRLEPTLRPRDAIRRRMGISRAALGIARSLKYYDPAYRTEVLREARRLLADPREREWATERRSPRRSDATS